MIIAPPGHLPFEMVVVDSANTISYSGIQRELT